MVDDRKSNQQQESGGETGQTDETRGDDVIVSAVRHVGPTLESDPKYFAVTNGGETTPEKLIEMGIGMDDTNVRDIVSRGTETQPDRRQQDQLRPGEPLKTRLPGDTSSDPHTDVGPDNATALQQKQDMKRNAA